MDFKIVKIEFLRGFYFVYGIVDWKSILFILVNVLFCIEGKECVLCGVIDFNVVMLVSLLVWVEKEGGLMVVVK